MGDKYCFWGHHDLKGVTESSVMTIAFAESECNSSLLPPLVSYALRLSSLVTVGKS